MPQQAISSKFLSDSLLEFPDAYRENGSYTCPPDSDEHFFVSNGILAADRISFWKVLCHDKTQVPFPVLGISACAPGKKSSYLDSTFFGWRSDAYSWHGGKVVREGVEWSGFKAKQQLVFRYDPVSSPKSHFLSVQVVNTDIEATIFIPCENNYRISMALNEGSFVDVSSASSVDVQYWDIQQELMHARDDMLHDKH